MERIKKIAEAFEGSKKPVAIFCEMDIIKEIHKELELKEGFSAGKFKKDIKEVGINGFGVFINGIEIYLVDEIHTEKFLEKIKGKGNGKNK